MTTLPYRRELTADDLAAMPDDGHRYELIDGSLIVTPSPSRAHQSVAALLARLLFEACPPSLTIRFAPLDVRLDPRTVLQPDLLVIERAGYLDESVPLRPLLTIEVLSPSTRLVDLNLKMARYEQAGIPSYWVVDPGELRLRAWDLVDAAYVPVADVTGDERWTAVKPFPVTITPARLLD
ncbi:MAG: Uma2 family endonuclease [Tetrasphaera sp.]